MDRVERLELCLHAGNRHSVRAAGQCAGASCSVDGDRNVRDGRDGQELAALDARAHGNLVADDQHTRQVLGDRERRRNAGCDSASHARGALDDIDGRAVECNRVGGAALKAERERARDRRQRARCDRLDLVVEAPRHEVIAACGDLGNENLRFVAGEHDASGGQRANVATEPLEGDTPAETAAESGADDGNRVFCHRDSTGENLDRGFKATRVDIVRKRRRRTAAPRERERAASIRTAVGGGNILNLIHKRRVHLTKVRARAIERRGAVPFDVVAHDLGTAIADRLLEMKAQARSGVL